MDDIAHVHEGSLNISNKMRGPLRQTQLLKLYSSSPSTAIENNLSRFNLKIVTNTSKTLKDFIATKQNNYKLNLEGEICSIICNICHEEYVAETSKHLHKMLYEQNTKYI